MEYSTYKEYKMLLPPEKFEAGLQDYAGIIGLGVAVKYLQLVGFDDIQDHEFKLNRYITEELIKIPRIKIIGPTNSALRSGIISFYIEGLNMNQFAVMLDSMSNVMIRSGRHCVHSWFDARGIINSARVSLYFYNTMKEAKIFVESINKIIKII